VKRSLSVLLAVLAVAAVGCGQSDTDQVKGVVQTYVDGLAARDGKKVCDQLAGSVQTQVKQRASAKDCATAINRFQSSSIGRAVAPAFKTAKIQDVSVKNNTATVTLEVKVGGRDTPVTVPLEKVSGNWKISATAGS
jgi:hypothetical protein